MSGVRFRFNPFIDIIDLFTSHHAALANCHLLLSQCADAKQHTSQMLANTILEPLTEII